jgi:hypothetical protein
MIGSFWKDLAVQGNSHVACALQGFSVDGVPLVAFPDNPYGVRNGRVYSFELGIIPGEKKTYLGEVVQAARAFNMTLLEDDWPAWTAEILERIARNDMAGAAWSLLNCLRHEEFTEEDGIGYTIMFTHPMVMSNAGELWQHMLPDLGTEFIEEVRQEMIAVGWNI